MPAVISNTPAHLLLVGRGDDRPRLEAIVQSLGMEAYIHFLGHVPEDQLPNLYHACDIFAMVSNCEVQSIPTLQALAAGLPVVAACAAALTEVVVDERNGILIPPGDIPAISQAVLRLVDDPELRVRLGQAGVEIGKAHADEDILCAFDRVYLEIIESHRQES
jgi:glycosyltransferase involved in cell wall biosynthesis